MIDTSREYSILRPVETGVIENYILVDKNNNQLKCTKEQVIYLIAKDKVVNSEVQINNNEIIIVPRAEIQTHNKNENNVNYKLIGQIDKGSEKDYIIIDNNSKKLICAKECTKEQVIYLAGRGQVTNCIVRLDNDKVVLVGKGISLKDLPTYKSTDNNAFTGEELIQTVRYIVDCINTKKPGFISCDVRRYENDYRIKLVRNEFETNIEAKKSDANTWLMTATIYRQLHLDKKDSFGRTRSSSNKLLVFRRSDVKLDKYNVLDVLNNSLGGELFKLNIKL